MTKKPSAGEPVAAGVPRSHKLAELAFVGVIVVFSAIALVMTGAIREPVGSSNVLGARVVPYAVTSLMLVASLAAVVAVLRGDVGSPEEGEDVDEQARTSWKTVLLLTLAFASLMVVIPLAGWPIAVIVVFTGSALALGSTNWWRALLVGAALGVITQLLFGSLLGLSLPVFGTVLPGVFGG